ncbi:MAG: D-alanyl-D-alanine carboxypeptidase family protein [Jatrophihabitans sp.]|uniref:D-alanyl-D-alanine carboxypeptidase family protein n=1 Tax=Jatrophihabitans sp. TaxID=1932789 RepID=UPI00390DE241
MRYRGMSGALAALLLTGALAPAATAVPTPSTAPTTHAVPPSAPTPTDSGNSPAAPDPHPGRGGIGPDGKPVGGAALLGRRLVLPRGMSRPPAAVTARAWIVVDLDDGRVLAARDPHGRYQPASIQKLLTTITLLPLLPGTRRVVVSRRAADTEGSHAGLVPGGTYTVDQLFRGLLLVSGNDAAEALAEAAGGRAKTVALMNASAQRLGGYDTYVQTPSGLDGWQQLTSAYDMALVLRAALAQPRFLAYDRALRATLPAQPVNGFGPVELDNQNAYFLTKVKGALVAKTGFTDAAQHTFVGALQRGGHRYGVVLLRAQRWPEDQWQQATKLVAWAAAFPAGTAPVGTLNTPRPVPVGDTNSAKTTFRHALGGAGAAGTGGSSTLQLLGVIALLAIAVAFSWRYVRLR